MAQEVNDPSHADFRKNNKSTALAGYYEAAYAESVKKAVRIQANVAEVERARKARKEKDLERKNPVAAVQPVSPQQQPRERSPPSALLRRVGI